MQNEANVNLGHLTQVAQSHEATKVNTKEKSDALSMQRFAAPPEELQNEPTDPFPRVAPSLATGLPIRSEEKCKTKPNARMAGVTERPIPNRVAAASSRRCDARRNAKRTWRLRDGIPRHSDFGAAQCSAMPNLRRRR
jgi:hypothetical protein